MSDARHGLSPAQGWLSASEPRELPSGSGHRVVGMPWVQGSSWWVPSKHWPWPRLLTAELSWSFSALGSCYSRGLWWAGGGLPTPLHPSSSAGHQCSSRALPGCPISLHLSITSALNNPPGGTDGLETQRVCRDMAPKASWAKTSCIKTLAFICCHWHLLLGMGWAEGG